MLTRRALRAVSQIATHRRDRTQTSTIYTTAAAAVESIVKKTNTSTFTSTFTSTSTFTYHTFGTIRTHITATNPTTGPSLSRTLSLGLGSDFRSVLPRSSCSSAAASAALTSVSLTSHHTNLVRHMSSSKPQASSPDLPPRETLVVGLCQIDVGADKQVNLDNAYKAVKSAFDQGARFIMLPECFNCPYGNSFFKEYAEAIPDAPCTDPASKLADPSQSPTVVAASKWASDLGVYLIAGSIPERDADGKLYNTSMVFDPSGSLIAKHRKLHLFDIDIPGKITFKESLTLSAGNSITMFEVDPTKVAKPALKPQTEDEIKQAGGIKHPATSKFKVGLGICYDIRFPEYAQVCVQRGARMLVYPGAFNTVTGPAHWELLQRARAIDNQVVSSCQTMCALHAQCTRIS